MPPKPPLSFQHVALLGAAGRELARATARRLRHGPSHPSWPWLYEFTAAFLRTATTDFDPLAVAWARGQVSPMPLSVRRKVRLEISKVAGRKVDLYQPTSARDGAPTLLYLHGGGYVSCSPASHRDTLPRIAHVTGARLVAPYYRLAPEHPYPAALEDALAVYRALLQQGTSPDRIFVAGDSAGGGLALALMLRLREDGDPLPRAACLISPWVDLALSDEESAPHDYLSAEGAKRHARAYAGLRALTDPFISPIHADLSGLPPWLVQTGEWELFCEQNRRLVARARAAGVQVDHQIEAGMLHAYPCFAGVLPQGRAALGSIGAFVRAQAALPPRDLLNVA